MFENRPEDSDHPLKTWGRRHPRLALSAIGAIVLALILSLLAGVHRPGVLMITPGKKATPLTQGLLGGLAAPFQRLPSLNQANAATRQAEASG